MADAYASKGVHAMFEPPSATGTPLANGGASEESSMAEPPPFDADAYVEQASRLVGLTIAPEHRPGVAGNMALIARMADLVMGLPLAVEDEPAPVFEPRGSGA